MHTSAIAIALAGFLATHAPMTSSPEPEWWRDYSAAQEKGRQEKKPLAVFVGSGSGGYESVSREGRFSDLVKTTLAHKYVCVYLDGSVNSTQEMIQALYIDSTGLVISDRSGRYQAFHHNGQLEQSDLAKRLADYASVDAPIRSTVTNTPSRASYYQSEAPTFARNC
ncbi:MAG: hypothetical protein HY040_06265 [Planctomycetes bacterium]|nr:hypothetical protein [Planctomycetota bacterium]